MAKDARQLSFTSFGTIFNNAEISVEEAFEEANLNYVVDAQPLVRVPQHILDSLVEGKPTIWTPTTNDIIKSHKATYRDDHNHTLGVVGRDYGIVQNSKAFEFLESDPGRKRFDGGCRGTCRSRKAATGPCESDPGQSGQGEGI